MDTVSIHGLKVTTTIGVLPFERQIKQTLLIDLAWQVDTAVIAERDCMDDCVDYTQVASQVQTFVDEHHFFLIETLAEKLVVFLGKTFHLSWLTIKLTKPGVIQNANGVTVSVERSF